MPSTVVGQTKYTASPVFGIDEWKRYREVDGGGYVECTVETVDYTCPWVKSGVHRVYAFNAPAPIEEDLSIGDVVTYQWRPAGYDADIDNAADFYITSAEYTIVESLSSTANFMVYSNINGLAMA